MEHHTQQLEYCRVSLTETAGQKARLSSALHNLHYAVVRKGWSWASSVDVTWEPVRNANYRTSPQTYCMRNWLIRGTKTPAPCVKRGPMCAPELRWHRWDQAETKTTILLHFLLLLASLPFSWEHFSNMLFSEEPPSQRVLLRNLTQDNHPKLNEELKDV